MAWNCHTIHTFSNVSILSLADMVLAVGMMNFELVRTEERMNM